MTVGKMAVMIITIYLILWLPLIDIIEYIDCSLASPAGLVLVEWLCCQSLLSCGATIRCKTKFVLY
jgi:hypothetical protein